MFADNSKVELACVLCTVYSVHWCSVQRYSSLCVVGWLAGFPATVHFLCSFCLSLSLSTLNCSIVCTTVLTDRVASDGKADKSTELGGLNLGG